MAGIAEPKVIIETLTFIPAILIDILFKD